ncbi:MAG: type II secretion system protein GspM [Gammaproteobacteria bacterium]
MNEFNKYSGERWLALSLLLLLIALVAGVLIVPLVTEALELNDEKNELIFRLQRYQRVINRKDDVYDKINKIKAEYKTQGYFSSQGTAALASADLQQVIKNAIATAGGQLTSTQVLPSKDQGEFTLIGVKVRMSGDIEVLRSVLYRIETAVPFLVVDELDVRPERGRRNRKTRQIEPSNKMNVSFQVSSFMSKRPS